MIQYIGQLGCYEVNKFKKLTTKPTLNVKKHYKIIKQNDMHNILENFVVTITWGYIHQMYVFHLY